MLRFKLKVRCQLIRINLVFLFGLKMIIFGIIVFKVCTRVEKVGTKI